MDDSEELNLIDWELTKLLYASIGAITMGNGEDAVKLMKEEEVIHRKKVELMEANYGLLTEDKR